MNPAAETNREAGSKHLDIWDLEDLKFLYRIISPGSKVGGEGGLFSTATYIVPLSSIKKALQSPLLRQHLPAK